MARQLRSQAAVTVAEVEPAQGLGVGDAFLAEVVEGLGRLLEAGVVVVDDLGQELLVISGRVEMKVSSAMMKYPAKVCQYPLTLGS